MAKLQITQKRSDTNHAPYVEYIELLARKLYEEIRIPYEARCMRQGSPLNTYYGRKKIVEYLTDKLTITVTANVTMKELDELFEE